jgi:hypothetical protein
MVSLLIPVNSAQANYEQLGENPPAMNMQRSTKRVRKDLLST